MVWRHKHRGVLRLRSLWPAIGFVVFVFYSASTRIFGEGCHNLLLRGRTRSPFSGFLRLLALNLLFALQFPQSSEAMANLISSFFRSSLNPTVTPNSPNLASVVIITLITFQKPTLRFLNHVYNLFRDLGLFVFPRPFIPLTVHFDDVKSTKISRVFSDGFASAQ